MAQYFFDAHLHSEYSLLDGMVRLEEIIANTENRGHDLITCTDHGNMDIHPRMAEKAQEIGLRHIVGCEWYLVDESRPRGNVHLNSWAINKKGYHNLCELSKLSYSHFHYRPRITKEEMIKYKDGIIWSDACIGGTYHNKIIGGDVDVAYEYFKWFIDNFGDNFIVEYHNHKIEDEIKCNNIKSEWCKKHGIPMLAMIDTHYALKSDKEIHEVMLAMQTKGLYGSWKFEGDGYHFLDNMELMQRFPIDTITNTYDYFDRMWEEQPIEFKRKELFPVWK